MPRVFLMCKLLFETGSCLFGRTDYSAPRPVLQTLAGNVTELDIFNQIQSLRFFRSAMRTSYYLRSHSEFSILSTCPVLQEKSRSPLQPYKSSQDHCQPIKPYIASAEFEYPIFLESRGFKDIKSCSEQSTV